ncbi:hypothetical protein B0F90DRAFT_1753383, partial [Multifurca ochricompacta]
MVQIPDEVFRSHGITLLYHTFNLMIQTFLYGKYLCIAISVSTYMIIQKGLRSPGQRVLFAVMIFMFSLSTAFLCVSMADSIVLIKAWYLTINPSTSTKTPTEDLLVFFNALVVLNYVLTDGVVIWRAWVICRDEGKKLLVAAIVMFVLTMLTALATIGTRIAIIADPLNGENRLAYTISVFQEITLISSLITNILGTGAISIKAWRHRRQIVADLNVKGKRTMAERVLALLIESGVIYILSGLMLALSSLFRLPGSGIKLGNLYLQASVQLAGLYPLVVVILVNRESSIDKTIFNSSGRTEITNSQETHYGRILGSFDAASSLSSIPSHSSMSSDIDLELQPENDYR